MIDKDLSVRFDILKSILITGIVFIHMNTSEMTFNGKFANFFTDGVYYISEVLARVSVPLFFSLAGYLFFINLTPTLKSFFHKYKSRFFSLVVPFVFWNLLIFILFYIAQNIPATQGYFSGERPIISHLKSSKEYLELFFGFGKFEYPIAYQFWFIRDLIVLVLFSPLIYFILKLIPKTVFFTVMLIFWCSFPDRFISLVFFLTGSFFAIKKINPKVLDRYFFISLTVFLLSSFFLVKTKNPYLYQAVVLIGSIVVFGMTKYILNTDKLKTSLIKFSTYSFFIFCFHEPTLSVVRKLSFRFFPLKNDTTTFLLYFFCVGMTIWISIVVFKILKRYMPNFLNIITGQRI